MLEDLPTQERGVFNKILKAYAAGNYKIGLKLCKKILDQPNLAQHAETNSLKAIMIGSLGNMDEAYALAKRAITFGIKSQMCWHIFGMIQRTRRDYANAFACFKTANRLAPTDMRILNDCVGVLVVQRRYREAADYAHKIYEAEFKATGKITNVMLARYGYCLFLCGEDLARAYSIIGRAVDDVKRVEKLALYESESYLQFCIAEKCNNVVNMRDSYKLYKQSVRNRERLLFMRWKMNKTSTVEKKLKILMKLLVENCENHHVVHKIVDIFVNEKSVEPLQVFEILLAEFEHSAALHSVFFSYFGENSKSTFFEEVFQRYLDYALRKKMTFAFINSLNLNKMSKNFSALFDFIEGMLLKNCEQSELVHFYVAHLNVLYKSKSHIISSNIINRIDKLAEVFINSSDVAVLRHMYLERVGRYEESLNSIENAANIENNDRYLNSLHGKACFRSHKSIDFIEESVVNKFLRLKNTTTDKIYTSYQCQWFIIAKAKLFFKEKNFDAAMDYVKMGLNLYNDFIYDQLDFFNYSIRTGIMYNHYNYVNAVDSFRRESEFFAELAALFFVLTMKMEKIDEEFVGELWWQARANKFVRANNFYHYKFFKYSLKAFLRMKKNLLALKCYMESKLVFCPTFLEYDQNVFQSDEFDVQSVMKDFEKSNFEQKSFEFFEKTDNVNLHLLNAWAKYSAKKDTNLKIHWKNLLIHKIDTNNYQNNRHSDLLANKLIDS